MRKIIYLYFFISAFYINNVYSATATGSGSETVTIVGSCNITATAYNWGTLNNTSTGVTKTVSPSTSDGIVFSVSCPSTISTINATVPSSITMTTSAGSSNNTFSISNITAASRSSSSTTLLTISSNKVALPISSGSGTLVLGGTASVASANIAGTYTGSASVTISF